MRRLRLAIVFALTAAPLSAQLAKPETQTGLLIVAHGAGSEWNTRVRAAVAQVKWDGPVAIAFLMGAEAETSGWNRAVDTLLSAGAQALVVVPLMVSSHGGHYRDIVAMAAPGGNASHGSSSDRAHRALPLPARVTGALDAAPELGDALAARWTALDSADRRRPVMLIAHGPEDDAAAQLWVDNLTATTERALRGAGLRQPLAVGLLRDDAAPEVRAAAVATLRAKITSLAPQPGDSVLVLTALISSGAIDRVKIPRDLEGLPVRYVPTPLAPGVELARWIERVAREARVLQ